MKTTSQTIVLDHGDYLTLKLPNGMTVEIGFGGTGQVPKDKCWAITVPQDERSESAYSLELNGRWKAYQLQ